MCIIRCIYYIFSYFNFTLSAAHAYETRKAVRIDPGLELASVRRSTFARVRQPCAPVALANHEAHHPRAPPDSVPAACLGSGGPGMQGDVLA